MALLAKRVSKIFPSNRRGSIDSQDPLVTRQKSKGLFRRHSTESYSHKKKSKDPESYTMEEAAAMATAAVNKGGRWSINTPLSSPKKSLKRVFRRSSKSTPKEQLHQQKKREETTTGAAILGPLAALEKQQDSIPTEEQRLEHEAQDPTGMSGDACDCHDAGSEEDSTLETSPTPVPRETKDPTLLLSVPDLPELSFPDRTKDNASNQPDGVPAAAAEAVTPKQLLPRPLKFAKTPDSSSSCCDGDGEEDREARRSATTPPVAHVEVPVAHQPFALAPLLPDLGGRFTDRPPPRAGEWDDNTLESHPIHQQEEDEDETMHSEADDDADYEAVVKMKPLIERAARMALLQKTGDSSRSSPPATGRHSFAAKPTPRNSELSAPDTLPEAFLRGPARTPEQRLRQRYHRYNSCYQTHHSARPTRHGLRDSRRALLASLDSTAPPAVVLTNLAAPPLVPRISPLPRRHSHQPRSLQRQLRHPEVPQHPQQQRIVKWHVVQSSQPAGQPA